MTVLRTYRHDMQRARDRIAAVPSQMLDTRFGTIEYAEQGVGLPLLVADGVLGCHVDGIDGWWADLAGPGFRVIAPSRFGYFGSTLPTDASPADQADAYALLLDHLGVDRVVAMGFSAGSASVLELARRHAGRVRGLILASARLGGGVTANKMLAPIIRVAYGAERTFWAFKKIMPMTYARMMGAPKGDRPRPDEVEALRGIRELLFPLRPRRDGAVYDGFVGNPVADRFPFEQLEVPTLIVSATDDALAPYAFATRAARRIPNGRLVTIERGGHLFLGNDDKVREEIRAFITSALHVDTNGREAGARPARGNR
jgi:pimeloyl-ACP methyl ester carboxylesterase